MERINELCLKNIITHIDNDFKNLELKIENIIKSDITKKLSDSSYYNYDELPNTSFEIYDFITKKYIENRCHNHNLEKCKTIINEFKNFVKNEKIIYEKVYTLNYNKQNNYSFNSFSQPKYNFDYNLNSRDFVSYYDFETTKKNNKNFTYNEFFNYLNYHIPCKCNNNLNFCDSRESQCLVQFIFVTNFGRIISNNLSYFAKSELIYKHYYYWLPLDYIKIIQNIEPYYIYDFMDFIIEKLYNRTTTAPILSDLEIEIFKIENEIKNKEIQLNEIKKDNIKKNKENDDLMKEYNELIEIEKNYLLLMNDLDKETEIFNFFS
jgi:hypothetical protein